MQYGMSPYGPPPQVPRPTTPVEPSTPRGDASQVNLSFLFMLEFKILTMSLSVLLQGSQISQAPVVPFWTPMPWGPPGGQAYPPPPPPPQSVPGAWPPPMPWGVPSWTPAPGGQAMPWGMPPWMPRQRPPSSATV